MGHFKPHIPPKTQKKIDLHEDYFLGSKNVGLSQLIGPKIISSQSLLNESPNVQMLAVWIPKTVVVVTLIKLTGQMGEEEKPTNLALY